MSVFRLYKPDCVFIHIPKTGGTSIRKGAWAGRYDPAFHGLVPEAYADLFKFAFVRHPFDRFVSVWKMFSTGTIGNKGVNLPPDHRPIDAYETLEIIRDDSIIYDERRSSFEEKIRHHGIPQTHPFNCLTSADFVGRFESLEADFAKVCARLGCEFPLKKTHYTVRSAWQDEIPADLIAPLRAYYSEDFDVLGYACDAV